MDVRFRNGAYVGASIHSLSMTRCESTVQVSLALPEQIWSLLKVC